MQLDFDRIVLKQLLAEMGFSTSKLGSATRGTLRIDPLRADLAEAYWRMEANILATQVCKDRQRARVEYPASWWQHLKYQLPGRLGTWVRRRRPVRMAKAMMMTEFTSYDTYPRAEIQMPELGVPVQLDRMFTNITAEAPGTATELHDGISRQREFVPERELTLWLQNMVIEWLIESKKFNYYLEKPQYPDPHVVIAELMKVLAACQVNTSQLVRRHSMQNAMKL